jgi:hypothetical protein
LSDDADGYVIADAIKLVSVSPGPADIVMDDSQATFFGTWSHTQDPIDIININQGRNFQPDSIMIRKGEHVGLVLIIDPGFVRKNYNVKIITERYSDFEFKVWRP